MINAYQFRCQIVRKDLQDAERCGWSFKTKEKYGNNRSEKKIESMTVKSQ